MSFQQDNITPEALADLLANEIEAVCRDLGLKGHVIGKSLVVPSPWNHPHAKAEPKLYIDVRYKRGTWVEWRDGDKGDVLWLVAAVLRQSPDRSKSALGEAIKWAKVRYGLGGSFDRAAYEKRVAEARAAAKKRDADNAEALKKKRGRAKWLWTEAKELTPDTLGYQYLEARAIRFERLERMPRAIKYSPNEPYWESGKEIYHGPALLTAMTLPDGSFAAIHKTYLDPDIIGEKINLGIAPNGEPRAVRKMWPDTLGGVMRIWRGSSGLSEREAVKNGLVEDVIVCEGVEDALSLAMIDPSRRIIAAGSLSGLMNMTPPACADTITISADNDWGKPGAMKQLDAACARLFREFGMTVKIVRSPVGKDFNDLLRACTPSAASGSTSPVNRGG